MERKTQLLSTTPYFWPPSAMPPLWTLSLMKMTRALGLEAGTLPRTSLLRGHPDIFTGTNAPSQTQRQKEDFEKEKNACLLVTVHWKRRMNGGHSINFSDCKFSLNCFYFWKQRKITRASFTIKPVFRHPTFRKCWHFLTELVFEYQAFINYRNCQSLHGSQI